MISTEVQRTIVKSPPELWAELSDPAALARHLGELGEIRITRVEPEEKVEWEADGATGTITIKPSGWGTKVTLSVTRDPAAAAAVDAPGEPAAPPEPQDQSATAPPAESPLQAEAESSLASEAESSPQPEADFTPAPEAESSPEPEAEALPEPEAEALPAPEAEALPAPEAEALPAPEAEALPEPEAEALPAPEAEAAPALEPGILEPEPAETDEQPGFEGEPAASEAPQHLTPPPDEPHLAPAPESRRGFFARLMGRIRALGDERPSQEPVVEVYEVDVEQLTEGAVRSTAEGETYASRSRDATPDPGDPQFADADAEADSGAGIDPGPQIAGPESFEPALPEGDWAEHGVDGDTGSTALPAASEETAPEPDSDTTPVELAVQQPAAVVETPTPAPAADAEATRSLGDELRAAEEAGDERVEALLTATLDRLGAAHHRPFSRA